MSTENAEDYIEIKGVSPSESEGTSSLFGGYTILAKSMMGSGLLGVAAACAKSGWIIGCLLALIIPAMTFLSLHLLAAVAIKNMTEIRPLTFFKLCNSVLGKVWAWFVEISLILKTFGAAIVYLQVAGSMLANLIYSPDSMSMTQATLCRIIQISIAAVFTPFCFMEKINNTRYANAVGICCLFFVLVTACVYFDPNADSTTSLGPVSFLAMVSKIPIFVFAYCCHQNVFLCVSEIRRPSVRRMDIIMALSCLTGFLLYIPVQIFPYWTFGESVADNFLKNLPASDIVVKIAFVCAAASVSISFPLQIIPLRNSVCALITGKPGHETARTLRIMVASIAILGSLGIAIAVSSLGIVMAITGLIGGNTICFLAPSLLYIKTFPREKGHRVWYLAVALLGTSIALYPLCLVGIILTA